MKRSVSVQTEHYRGFQIETRDTRGEGWLVRISSSDGTAPGGTILSSASPLALAALLSEARDRIDSALLMAGEEASATG
jgi:hypothetical protein